MLKRQVADLEHCGRDQSSMKSTTTKYIWKWEFPKDIDANSDKTVLTLVSRQLFIDVSPEQRVQTYLQMAPEGSDLPACKWLLKVVMVKEAWLLRWLSCVMLIKRRDCLVHYFILQTYLLLPEAIFQAHSLASAEWEKLFNSRKLGVLKGH